MEARKANPSRRARKDAAGRLHSAAIHLLRRVRRRDVESGIGPAQLSALSVLVFGGPRTLGALAEAEGVRPPTMTRIAQGLVEGGLARREVDRSDHRVVRLRATARGGRLLREGRRKRIQELDALLAGLTEAEVRTLGAAAELIERMLR